MNKLAMVKAGAALVVTVGVGTILKVAIGGITPSDASKMTKICIGIGGLALTGLIGDAAAKHTENEIDDVVDAVSAFKDMFKKKKTEEGEATTEGA